MSALRVLFAGITLFLLGNGCSNLRITGASRPTNAVLPAGVDGNNNQHLISQNKGIPDNSLGNAQDPLSVQAKAPARELSTPVMRSQKAAASSDSLGESGAPEVHREFASLDERDRFIGLIAERTQREDEVRVLKALLAEKNEEFSGYQKVLRDSFDIDLDLDYRYDHEAATLYVVDSKSQPVAERIHRRFDSEPDVLQFVQTANARDFCRNQIQVLEFVLQEKRVETQVIANRLLDEFDLRDDQLYRFDGERNVLYIMPAPEEE